MAKIRGEIGNTKILTIPQIQWSFFEKIGKLLAKLSNSKWKKIQMNKIINKKGDVTTDANEIQKIIGTHLKHTYSTKLEILKKWWISICTGCTKI